MSIFRSTKSRQIERPTMLLKLRLINKKGEPIDEQDAWQALVDAFRKHPTLDVHQLETFPDKYGQE